MFGMYEKGNTYETYNVWAFTPEFGEKDPWRIYTHKEQGKAQEKACQVREKFHVIFVTKAHEEIVFVLGGDEE
jgi:hypothetical protein